MKAIFTALSQLIKEGRDSYLVIVVHDTGSAPRGKGSMMLVVREGLVTGTVGGGAVEYEAVKRAQTALKNSEGSFTSECDLSPSGELGMVCGGNISLLFSRLNAGDAQVNDLTERVLDSLDKKQPGTLSFYAGDKCPVLNALSEECKPVLTLSLPIGERVLLFGAGHVAAALCPLLTSVGFRVTVIDDRAEYANAQRFPYAERTVCAPYESALLNLQICPEDFIVIMTNGHAHDCTVEEFVLRYETAYVGVIGSRAKTKAVNEKLLLSGISEEKLTHVHAPIGTPIKAVTPEEIAVSIAGEMILERALRREQAGEPASHGCPMHRD